MALRDDLNKYSPRKEQQDALNFIKKSKKDNPNTKFFLLNLPTGIGKSHLALMISQWAMSKNNGFKVDLVTAGKMLQDQYTEEYESINSLKGKENYNCSQYGCSCDKGKEFNRLNKSACVFCPYDDARTGYISGQVSLTNFHLYLIYSIYNIGISEQRDSNVLIVDEADQIDDVISDFISIKITESIIKKMRFSNDYEIVKKLNDIKNISEYVDFLKFLSGEIISTIQSLESGMSKEERNIKMDSRDVKISSITGEVNKDVKLMQIANDLNQYQSKITLFLKEYKQNPDNWVLESNINLKTNHRELSLEPIWANEYLEKYVWSRYDMVVLMSGTILDKDLFSELNGIDKSRSVYYSIDSPFPIKNRPIYYMPLGKMSYAKKEETFKNYIPYLNKILKKYDKSKGVFHTNSFELSKWTEDALKNDRLLFYTSSNKDDVLKMHFGSEDPTVLIGPSMATGVSFDHDKSRFQVILKVPYPSLNSIKIKKRKEQNPDYYAYKTVASIIQMCGRSCRSVTDYSDTIIIDGSFGDVLRYSSKYIPKWVQDSIKKIKI